MLSTISGLVSLFLTTAVVSVFADNIILKKGIDIQYMLSVREKNKYRFIGQSVLLTFVMIISALPIYIVYKVIKDFEFRIFLIPIVNIILITAVYFMIRVICESWFLKAVDFIGRELTVSVYSCVLLSTIVMTMIEDYRFLQVIAVCLGTGVGYFIANLLIVEGFRRITLSDVPKAFKGLPVIFIYIGLLSLTVYGLKLNVPI